MKVKVGEIVWGRVGGVWWPGQVCAGSDACDEALCKQLPGHALVLLLGSNKWVWLPPQRITEFDTGYEEYTKEDERPDSKVWEQAVELARQANQTFNSTGKKQSQLAAQSLIHAATGPAAGSEVLFGHQQHPRAQSLILSLQKGEAASKSYARLSENGSSASGLESGSRGGNKDLNRVAHSIPGWPEYLHDANPGPQEVQAVTAADSLAWLRALAKGILPPCQLTPEQEVCARQQLQSLDLVRRQHALEAQVKIASGGSASALNADSALSPRTGRKVTRSTSTGLQPGTHTLTVPEEAARTLTAIKQHMQLYEQQQNGSAGSGNGHITPIGHPHMQETCSMTRRSAGSPNVLGTAGIDLVLRINGQVMPFTCAVTVQTLVQPNTPSYGSAVVSQSNTPSSGVIQHRVLGLHMVLQQLFPLASSGLPNNGNHTNGNGAQDKVAASQNSGSEKNDVKSEKQQLPGPVVEFWHALGPHKLMLSLNVPQNLLQLCAPGPPCTLLGSRISFSGDAASTVLSPRASAHVQQFVTSSVSAGLLATYGIIVPQPPQISSGIKRKTPISPTVTTTTPIDPNPKPGAATLSSLRSHHRQHSSGDCGEKDASSKDGAGGSTVRASTHTSHKRARHASGDGHDDPPGSAREKDKEKKSSKQVSPPPPQMLNNSLCKRPSWSSRSTPYDPSDPFSYPCSTGSAWGPAITQLPRTSTIPLPSPLAEPLTGRHISRQASTRPEAGSSHELVQPMGPPQARQPMHAASMARRSSETAMLSGLPPVNTGSSGFNKLKAASSGQAKSPTAEQAADHQDHNHVLQDHRNKPAQPGVLLVEITIRKLNKAAAADQEKGKATSAQRIPSFSNTSKLPPKEWRRARLEQGLAQMVQQLTNNGVIPKNVQAPGLLQRRSIPRPGEHGNLLSPSHSVRNVSIHRPQPQLPELSSPVARIGAVHEPSLQQQPLQQVLQEQAQSGVTFQQAPGYINGSVPAHIVFAVQPVSKPTQPQAPAVLQDVHATEVERPHKRARTDAQEPVAWELRPSLSGMGADAVAVLGLNETVTVSCQGANLKTVAGFSTAMADSSREDPRIVTKHSSLSGRQHSLLVPQFSTPLPVPSTPQLELPFARSQTPEGTAIQGLAGQLLRVSSAVVRLCADTQPQQQFTGPQLQSAAQVFINMRDKAAAVAAKLMSASLVSGAASQLRSEPLQFLLCTAREVLAACDVATAAQPTGTGITQTNIPPAEPSMQPGVVPIHALTARGTLQAFGQLGTASARLLQLLGGSGDEEEETSTGDEEPTRVSPSTVSRCFGTLGGLEPSEIEVLRGMAQPLIEIIPTALIYLQQIAGMNAPAAATCTHLNASSPTDVEQGAPASPVAHLLDSSNTGTDNVPAITTPVVSGVLTAGATCLKASTADVITSQAVVMSA